jgi:hypothetical protein
VLILRELGEKIGGCKWFGMNTYRRGRQVLIVKGLGRRGFASVVLEGVSGSGQSGGGGWAEIHGE